VAAEVQSCPDAEQNYRKRPNQMPSVLANQRWRLP